MFALVPFIWLWVRWSSFRKLTLAELPRISEDDLKRMHHASRTAFYVMLSSTVVSFAPYFVSRGVSGQLCAVAIGVVGLFIAAFFDLQAERIKRRGRPEGFEKQGDVIRWYHVLVAIMLPYVALPWGIVNLVRGKYHTGLVLVLFPVFFGTVIAICLIAANAADGCLLV